jgi:hypothetical protein
VDIQPDDYFTKYEDSTYSTGFGWFIFYNATTSAYTDNSNPIPYSDFEQGSVKMLLDSFFSTLNNKEMKLISVEDAFRWLNEGYSIAQNELNLVNNEYNIQEPFTVNAVSGTAEYDISSYNIGNIVKVSDSTGKSIDHIDIENVPFWNATTGNSVRYYLRGSNIGFTPIPSIATTYSIYTANKSTTLSSYYDNLVLPNNNYYFLMDFMLYRANEKLSKPNGANYAKFIDGIKSMKLTSFKQNDSKDTWGSEPTTLV